MKRAIPLIALISLAACGDSGSGEAASGGGQAGGPPPLPPYQMRAELPGGGRMAASASNGEALFSNRCGSCHLPGGMGTNLITMQRVKAGHPPDSGLLTNRDDLTADYVTAVVRNGKVAMPPLSRVEVTDAELAAIAGFLAGEE